MDFSLQQFVIVVYENYHLVKILNGVLIALIVWISLYPKHKDTEILGIVKIPEYPVVGNLFQILNNPSRVFMKWAVQYNAQVFQIRMGIINAVVVNSYQDVYCLWIKHSYANNSRPVLYTFHDIISATQGFTIGSTPTGLSYNKKKRAISTHLNKAAVEASYNIIDKQSKYMMKNIIKTNPEISGLPSSSMFRYSRSPLADIDIMEHGQFFALRSSIFITYGISIDCYHGDSVLAREIIEVESEIIKLRSPTSNLQDYLRILRYIPGINRKADSLRKRRDVYMDLLLSILRKKLKANDAIAANSMVAKLLSTSHCRNGLNNAEIQSLCLTMVSAGLDNTPLNFNHLMGHLSQPYGEKIQEHAFQSLLELYNNDLFLAWNKSALLMECDYVIALVRETLRYFTSSPMALPRSTTKTISFGKVSIPKGTLMFMNAYAANHDPKVFENPHQFLPQRWLNKNLLEVNHFAFGAGSRMCSGKYLAFKQLYTLTCRMILYFKVRPPTSDTLMGLDPFVSNMSPSATAFDPKLFKVRLEPRVTPDSHKLYNSLMKS